MATPKAKLFVLPEEVLKSRRNLIIIAYVACAILFLAPAITELRLAGVDVKFASNKNIPVLLALAIVIEFTTFYYRYRVSGFSDHLTRLEEKKVQLFEDVEKEQRINNIFKSDFERHVEVQIQQTNESILNTVKTVARDHKISEVYLPTCIAVFAFFWCMYVYIRSYL